jgi:hypothetical protein
MISCHQKPLSIQDSISLQIIVGTLSIGCLFYFQILISDFLESFLGIFAEGVNTLGGGFLSGGFHAMSGPDHLAAVLPFILGRKWFRSAHYGAIWGLGHGLTTSIMGIFGYYIKDSLLGYKLLPQLSSLADYAVGVTLIIIGIMGFLESRLEVHCDTEVCEKIDQNYSNKSNNNDEMITYKNHNDRVNDYGYSNSATKILYQIIEPNSVDFDVLEASNPSIDVQNVQNTFLHSENSIEKLNKENVTKVKRVRKTNFTIPVTVFLNGCLLGKRCIS